jgi:hypothetical protein
MKNLKNNGENGLILKSEPQAFKTTCAPNGLRYPRVGGTRQRHFAGTSFEPRKLPENAQTPTRRVHAVLGGVESFN